MKNRFLKAMFPVFAVALGVGGAFFTMSATDKDVLVQKIGHIRVAPTNCQPQNVICQTELSDQFCMLGATRLWGKYNETDSACPEILYRVEE